MRKIILIFVTFIILNISVYAEVGDIAGDVYETDIKTYFFDYEINSYNIGGKTVIICEDLGWYYGFYVDWKADERLLDITDEYKNITYIKDFSKVKQRNISQNIANRADTYYDAEAPEHIYYTDIVTVINGKEINSYNVNGRTAIAAEDLRDFGYDVIWDENARTLNVYERFENIPIDTDIGKGYITGWVDEFNSENARASQAVHKVCAGSDIMEFNCFMAGEYYYNMMYPLKEIFDFLDVEYSFENNILTIDTSKCKNVTEIDYQESKIKHNDLGYDSITYLYVDKVICDGKEAQISYEAVSGHFDNTRTQSYEAKPYLCNGRVYAPYSFISKIMKIPY